MRSAADLGRLLRQLRRREARRRGGSPPTYRELAARTGWSLGAVAEYFAGKVLPPTDRFDELVRLLGANPSEQGTLATIRDRVEEWRRIDATQPPAAHAVTVVARELPPDVSAFTGRAASLAELDRLVASTGRGVDTVRVAVVSGTAGVGKTALALHWAHRVADAFPDGQLYADLRGYDRDEPAEPGDVLAGFLRGLGVDGGALPADLAERAARYRTVLAARRVLIVLDNARTAEQVRPLLPGTASCVVVVTSRDDLVGLVARDGARRLVLDPFTPAESASLLRALVGDRADDEPAAATTLAQRCGYLPLALRLAAELAAARPGTRLGDLVDELAVERHRLAMLDAGGDPRAIRSVFSWSVRNLTAPAARAFVLLGLHPGRQFDRYALAALTHAPVDEAARLLDELARAHVIGAVPRQRYAMHDLMRAYAAERAASDLDPADARAALSRLLDFSVAAATAADGAMFSVEREPPAAHPRLVFDGPAPAQRWFDDERPNLVAACLFAAEHGRPRHGVELSIAMFRALDGQAHYQDAAAVHQVAERASRVDPRHRAEVLRALAITWYRLGRRDEALARMREALAASAGDRRLELRMLCSLGLICNGIGRYREAAAYHERALALSRAVGDAYHERLCLGNLGLVCTLLGRWAEASGFLRRALAMYRDVGDRWTEGYVLFWLGTLEGRSGQPARGVELLRRSVPIAHEFDDRRIEAEILTELAALDRARHRVDDAVQNLGRALAIAREIGEPSLETAALNGLGETVSALGDATAALAHHRSAHALARRIGDRFELARALEGIALVRRDTGRTASAQRHWRNALAMYVEMGVPEADRVRRRLAQLGAS